MLAPAPSAAEPSAPSHPIGGDGRVAFGAASALAAHADVAPVAVRLGFLVLTVAAGIGIPLYGVAWLLLVWRQEPPTRPVPSRSGDQRRTLAVALIVAGIIAVARTRVDSVPDRLVWPAGVVALGLAFLWPRLDTGKDPAATLARAGAIRVLGALILVAGGLGSALAANLSYETVRDGLAAALFVVVGTLLLFAPWLYRLIESLGEERRQRVRADERAAVAAHLHDSVLQTLTLIQKRAEDPRAMSALARHQERELRRWLYEPASTVEGDSLQAALEATVSTVETDHLVSIDNVTVGDAVMDDRTTALVAATREALVNAAKFAGTRSVSLYARTTQRGSEVFVRDRGIGFELDKVPADRHGIRDSIVGRMARVGGRASIRTTPGEGTEVHLEVTR